jgi:hypothetical protein
LHLSRVRVRKVEQQNPLAFMLDEMDAIIHGNR